MKAKVLFCNSLLSRSVATKAFTLIELLVVIVTVAILVVMVLPALAKTKSNDQRINCVYNLKQVGQSFRLWGQNHGGRYPMRVSVSEGGPANQANIVSGTGAAYIYQVFGVMSNELGSTRTVICPADGDRYPRTNFVMTTGTGADFRGNGATSYFVGKDADESSPREFLSGDRNMGIKPAAGWTGTVAPGGVTGYSPNSAVGAQGTGPNGYYVTLASVANNANLQWTDKLHQAKGNIVLCDGSVQQYTSTRMRGQITNAAAAMATYFP